MDQNERQILTDKLRAWREELLREAERTVDDMNTDKAQFADPTDRASLETDRNFELRIRDRERRLIAKIDQALERMEDGTFGLCEDCGEPIEFKRLEARPVATLCIRCKTAHEEDEKLKKG